MANDKYNLGINISSSSLYYAVTTPESTNLIQQIGAFDFSFSISQVFKNPPNRYLSSIQDVIKKLKRDYRISSVRFSIQPEHECWCTLPKLVKDKEDEREAHVNILTKGWSRSAQQLYWFDVTHQGFKFLVIRDQSPVNIYQKMTESIPEMELVSEFEIGYRWGIHTDNRGSFLTISCTNSKLTIASYILGTLRSATYFEFDHIDDLPYLWKLYASHLPWIGGFHDQICLYGEQAEAILNRIAPYLDQTSEITVLNSLEKIMVKSPETTFGFNLELAFPAIMLSLDL